jgi:hypothetical protein
MLFSGLREVEDVTPFEPFAGFLFTFEGVNEDFGF